MTLKDLSTQWSIFEGKDKEAVFMYLYTHYHDAVRSYVRWNRLWRCSDDDEVEEVVNEIFLQFFKNEYRLCEQIGKREDGRNHLRALMCRIADNKLIDLRRKNSKRLNDQPLVEESVELNEFFDVVLDIQEMFEKLKEEHFPLYKISFARFIQGKTLKEIAQERDLTIDTVRYRVEKAKECIKEMLRSWEEK